jgi:hypothetical protein
LRIKEIYNDSELLHFCSLLYISAFSVPNGPINVYYSWTVENLAKGKFLIFMLKFVDSSSQQLATNKIDYLFTIKNGLHPIFLQGGTTFNGADMQIIDENTLQKDLENNLSNYYPMPANVNTFNIMMLMNTHLTYESCYFSITTS